MDWSTVYIRVPSGIVYIRIPSGLLFPLIVCIIVLIMLIYTRISGLIIIAMIINTLPSCLNKDNSDCA